MDADINPSEMSPYSLTVAGYAAGGGGMSGQFSLPYSGGAMATGGFCVGWGLTAVSCFYTGWDIGTAMYSSWETHKKANEKVFGK